MKWIEDYHEQKIAVRRVSVLSRHLAAAIPSGASVLDVGCGDGEIAHHISAARPDLTFTGVDVLLREETKIPVTAFDGRQLPYSNGEFDVVTFVDVLHHCDHPLELLREAHRVARRWIVIKDHTVKGFAAWSTLQLMDWVGNRRYGVALPYNYWREDQWQRAFVELRLQVSSHIADLEIYPWPLNYFFDRQLHFLVCLEKQPLSSSTSTTDGTQDAIAQPSPHDVACP